MAFLIYAVIALIAIAGFIWGVHCYSYTNYGIILMIICMLVACFTILLPLCIRSDYNKFEKSFELLSDYYEAFDATTDLNHNYIYVIDIIGANRELAEWQARHELYGIMSIVPDRVMDISPIGSQ